MVALSRLIAFLWWMLAHGRLRGRRSHQQKILVLHEMLLGDGILLMPIFQLVPSKHAVTVACPDYLIGVYKVFYPNLRYISFSEKKPLSVISMLLSGPYREVICPFERRMLRYAKTCRPKLVRTYVAPQGCIRDRALLGKVQTSPVTMSDMILELFPGQRTSTFQPLPQLIDPSMGKVCLLHVDAKNPNRRWTQDHWFKLANLLRASHFSIAWCLGSSASSHSLPIDHRYDELFTPENLVDYLDRIRRSALIVCPDTGIAHLAKLAMTPSAVIYGQGNPSLHGNGHYWSRSRTVNLFIDDIHCRDKNTAMGIRLDWLRRCDRYPKDCENPFCQNNIQPEDVFKVIRSNFPELFGDPGS